MEGLTWNGVTLSVLVSYWTGLPWRDVWSCSSSLNMIFVNVEMMVKRLMTWRREKGICWQYFASCGCLYYIDEWWYINAHLSVHDSCLARSMIEIALHLRMRFTECCYKLLNNNWVCFIFIFSEGSNLTPAHHYPDFRFKTYAPLAFRYFRELFGIKPDDYLVRACSFPMSYE